MGCLRLQHKLVECDTIFLWYEEVGKIFGTISSLLKTQRHKFVSKKKFSSESLLISSHRVLSF